jgi:hypothetical protein
MIGTRPSLYGIWKKGIMISSSNEIEISKRMIGTRPSLIWNLEKRGL